MLSAAPLGVSCRRFCQSPYSCNAPDGLCSFGNRASRRLLAQLCHADMLVSVKYVPVVSYMMTWLNSFPEFPAEAPSYVCMTWWNHASVAQCTQIDCGTSLPPCASAARKRLRCHGGMQKDVLLQICWQQGSLDGFIR